MTLVEEDTQLMKLIAQSWTRQSKCHHLVAKLATDASFITWWPIFFTNASANTRWPNLQLIEVVQSVGQTWNSCTWCHLKTKLATNANNATWWPNLKLMQVAPRGGSIWIQFKWRHLVAKFTINDRYGLNWQGLTLGREKHWRYNNLGIFLSDPGVPGVRSMGLGLCQWLTTYKTILQT